MAAITAERATITYCRGRTIISYICLSLHSPANPETWRAQAAG